MEMTLTTFFLPPLAEEDLLVSKIRSGTGEITLIVMIGRWTLEIGQC